MRQIVLAGCTAVLAACSNMGTAPIAASPEGVYPRVVPTVDGAVYIPEGYQDAYDSIGFAPVRRAGDVVYVSGVLVYRDGTEGTDVAAFKDQTRRAFKQLDTLLKSAGVGFEHVAMINSFHVWNSPHFTGTQAEHIAALSEVKAEFMPAPHPAWTAVGTSGLLEPSALVEIQLIAHVPPTGGKQ